MLCLPRYGSWGKELTVTIVELLNFRPRGQSHRLPDVGLLRQRVEGALRGVRGTGRNRFSSGADLAQFELATGI